MRYSGNLVSEEDTKYVSNIDETDFQCRFSMRCQIENFWGIVEIPSFKSQIWEAGDHWIALL